MEDEKDNGNKMEEEKNNEEQQDAISRRDFLKSAGLVLGGGVAGAAAGAGITSALTPDAELAEQAAP